ncbi:MAG: hypothetical protein F2681_00945 [Actinobacteria bacterium]|uniref:Unannotated protein n=1 Tax=freshwater metagenome TaxID=449393 RepID=A0A6J7IVT6_9ZZZZ|nr:hypothetical protein [Actinomycetota bacterium]MSW77702.1 hypothetical protein [Actinomycetota bacterium]MSX93264.1 hypothetical protein [Actinomycetota bacterium]MSZ81690.1 hypothetical protein [Actinomycetota bacterium]MTB18237.1 hypothetical protein [Actinomycetota bacterium]
MACIAFPSFDLSALDVRQLEFPLVDDKVVALTRDAAYVAIGFGVLAFQQAQVRRRELEKVVSGIVRSLTSH